jgi:hypothetical protein
MTGWPGHEQFSSCVEEYCKRLVDPKKNVHASTSHEAWTDEKFLKTMNQEGCSFCYLQQKFPWVSDATIKERILICPHLRELMNERI